MDFARSLTLFQDFGMSPSDHIRKLMSFGQPSLVATEDTIKKRKRDPASDFDVDDAPDSMGFQQPQSRKKSRSGPGRGRPKGSKNKPKPVAAQPQFTPYSGIVLFDGLSAARTEARRNSRKYLEAAGGNLAQIRALMSCLFTSPTWPPKSIPDSTAASTSQFVPRVHQATGLASPYFAGLSTSLGRTAPGASLRKSASSSCKQTPKISEHFVSFTKREAGTSAIEFPLLKASRFGLIQEELAGDPFHVLVAVSFLTKTAGTAAIPVLRKILQRYPTPEALAAADPEDFRLDIVHLGLGNKRSQSLVEMARAWVAMPPEMGKRWRMKDYPYKDAHKNIAPRDEPLGDDDPRQAFEIAHLPGVGPYAIDSWRIFCRDQMRGVRTGLKKKSLKGKQSAINKELTQEWTKVLPGDKELRAYLKWRWLRLGFDWNPETGEKKDVDRKVLRRMQKGTITEHELFQSPWKKTA